MRETYPLLSKSNMVLDTIEVDIDQAIENAPAFVEVEVIEVLPDYEHTYTEGAGDRKVDITLRFMQYKLKIIDILASDKSFSGELGEEIILSVNYMQEHDYPKLTEGMKVVLPIGISMDTSGLHTGKYLIYSHNIYYVTPDDYIISTYDESDANIIIQVKK